MTAVVSDTGYWLAKYTDDNEADVFDTEGETTEHPHTSNDVVYTHNGYENIPNIDHIRNILNNTQNAIEESGDIKENDVGVGVINNEDVIEVLPDSLEAHLDLSTDITYTSLSKRVSKPTSKILLNKKWGDTKI